MRVLFRSAILPCSIAAIAARDQVPSRVAARFRLTIMERARHWRRTATNVDDLNQELAATGRETSGRQHCPAFRFGGWDVRNLPGSPERARERWEPRPCFLFGSSPEGGG